MYLEIFLADFAVFRVFLGISRDFAEIPEFRGSATARNIRSPVIKRFFSQISVVNCIYGQFLSKKADRNIQHPLPVGGWGEEMDDISDYIT